MKIQNNSIVHFLFISISILALYWQCNRFEFVLDDKIVIAENNFVKKGINGISEIWNNDSMAGFLGKNPDLLAGGRYRPLSLIVFAFDYQLWALNTFNFHLQNTIFYLLACISLYYVLLLLFQINKPENQKFKFFAFIGVILFAIHPLHTEVVANIKGLDEILALLFGNLTFIFVLLYFDKNKFVYAVFGALSLLLSLLAKESTLPLLLAIPVVLYFFRDSTLKEVVKNSLILLVPVIFYLIIRSNALGFLINNDVHVTGIMNDPYFDATSSQKAGTILFTFLLYIKLLFFPHPLTHDYYPYHIQLIEIYHPLSLLSLVVIIFLFIYAIKGIKSRNKLAWIIFYFFITLSIVSNIFINVGAFMNERFLFVPSLAFSVLAVTVFLKFYNNKTYYTGTLIVVIIAFLGFGFKSFKRIPAWKNLDSLNEAAIKVSKNSARANCFYGVSIYQKILNDSIQERKLENAALAQKYIDKSLEIYPEYADALRMKAGIAAEYYKIDKDIDHLLSVFEEIQMVRPVAYLDEFTNWLEPRADKNKMADYYYKTGYEIYAVQKRNFGKASFYLQKGIALTPNHKNLVFGNCVISYLTSDYSKCIQYATTFLTLFGQNADVLFYLGNAKIKSGNPDTGIKDLNLAYQLKPELKNQN